MKTARYVLAFLLFFTSTFGVFAQPVPIDLDEQISYYQQKGNNAFENGNYTDAITHYEKVLEVAEKIYGAADTLTAFCHWQLGFVYEKLPIPKEAIQHYSEAAEIWKKKTGKEDVQYINTLVAIFNISISLDFLDDSNELRLIELMELVKYQYGELDTSYSNVLQSIAGLYSSKGEYSKAEPLYQHSLEIIGNIFGDEHLYYANSLNNLAELYWFVGRYKEAEPLYNRVSDIYKTTLGEEHPDYATTLDNLASLYSDMGNYQLAEPMYQKVLEITKKTLGEDHPDYAISLNNLAALFSDMGNYSQAEPLYQQALAITKKVSGVDHLDYATALSNLAVLHENMGNYTLSEPLHQQALEIRRKALGEDHPDYAISINNLAMFYERIGKYSQSELMCHQALAIRKKVLGEDHPDYAASISNLAKLHERKGNYLKAEPLYKQSLVIIKKSFGEEHPSHATSLDNLAVLYVDMGNYAKAELLYQQALEIRKTALGVDHRNYAISLNNMALLYYKIGNYAKAESLYKQSLKIIEKVLGVDHPDYATSLSNLAVLFNSMGNSTQAEPLCKLSLAIRKKTLGEDHPDYATSLNNLAILYKDIGNYAQAEPLFQQVLTIREKTLNNEHPDYAISLNNLAGLYKNMGNYTKAELLFQQALTILKKILGKDYSFYATSLYNLASLYAQSNKYPTAFPLFTQALQIYQNQIIQNFAWLSENQREQYFKSIGFNFDIFHSFALKAHKNIPQTLSDDYNYQLFTKGLQLATAQQMRNRIAASGDTALLADYENWLAQRRSLGKLYENTIAQRESMGIDIDSLEEAANRAEADLARRSEVFAEATDTTRYSWQDVQRKLQANEAAVEIARFNWFSKDWTDTVYYALMVITPQTKEHPTIIWLKNGNDLEGKHFKNYADALQRGENDFDSYLQYWKPLDSLLQGANKVFLSLDGIYHKINLEALLTPESKYLGDVKELQLVGSTKDLVKTKPATTKSLSALLIGNPAYSADSTQLASAAMPFKNPNTTDAYLPDNTRSATYQLKELPATQAEIDSIGAVLTKQGYRVHAYSGKQAVEEVVKSADSPRILHLATHGAFLADPSPDKQDNTRLLMGMDMQRATENPLLRSQLYFSGAQETLSGKYPLDATYDNGILTAYEAVNLNLRGTELVVLSACETGLGEVRNGEGAFGLQRAFQVAGARSVMMSLWKVSDSATSLFMSTFYRQWLQTGDKRQAFKATQQVLRANPNYKHPYFWGAFVLVGE
jgi:tetratricopeptide (TPR) repeat protein